MKIEKNEISPTTSLVGIHFFKKDHSFGDFKNQLINDVQDQFDFNFLRIKIGTIDLLKVENDDNFEIRLLPDSITLQDINKPDKITEDAEKIISCWYKYSKSSRVRLAGLVRNFELKLPKLNETHHLRITDQFFKENSYWKSVKGASFQINFSYTISGQDYNIHFTLTERTDPKYSYSGILDFNKISDNNIKGFSIDERKRIFSDASNYFDTELLAILNSSL